MPQKPSQAAIAEKLGVNQSTISRLKKEGVDIYNEELCRAVLEGKQKPAEAIAKAGSVRDDLTIDNAKNAQEMKFLKEREDALMKKHKREVEEGKYFLVEEGKEIQRKIVATHKAILTRIPHDSAQLLEGKSAEFIEEFLAKKIDAALVQLSEDQEEMYEE